MNNEELLKNGMISQSGECIVQLARHLLQMDVGDRIEPKSELAARYNLSVGTIQSGFKTLERLGAVRIISRGHLGSFVEATDKALLWDYSMYGYVRGTMPLPYHDLLIGLATGINDCFDQTDGIMLRMSYIRGSKSRIDNVAAGLDDFTVCSAFAAERAIEEGAGVHVYKRLGSNTYMGRSVLLLRRGVRLADGIRVGIDQSSFDQEILTRKLFEGYDVEFINVHYNNFSYMLSGSEIDACVWSAEDVSGFDGDIADLPPEMSRMIEEAGRAAIVVSSASIGKMRCIGHMLDAEHIEDMQQQVIAHQAMPNY